MPTITLTRADGGRTVDLRIGAVVVVRLEENPTTGYRWALEPGGDQVMALQGSEHVRASDAAIGGGGERLLTFKAVKAGAGAVRLTLRRAWEGNSVPETFAVRFRVQA